MSGIHHKAACIQGSYRIMTAVFQTFPGQNYFLFRLLEALRSSLCEQRTLQNWLLNDEISYTMYSSIVNTEWDSNFWTLNFRCFVSWTARKLTNASVINSVTDICIFQVNITVFKDFSRLFHTLIIFKTFQSLENFYIKFQDFPYFSTICTNPVDTPMLLSTTSNDSCLVSSLEWHLSSVRRDVVPQNISLMRRSASVTIDTSIRSLAFLISGDLLPLGPHLNICVYHSVNRHTQEVSTVRPISEALSNPIIKLCPFCSFSHFLFSDHIFIAYRTRNSLCSQQFIQFPYKFSTTDSTDSGYFLFFLGMSVLTLALCARLSLLLVSL